MSDLLVIILAIILSVALLSWMGLTNSDIKQLKEENDFLMDCTERHADILASHIKILQDQNEILEKLIEDKYHE